MATNRETLLAKVKKVEKRPGVYIFTGTGEKVLYVGKAINLRSRMSSYFQKSTNLEPRKKHMVRLVRDFSTIATDNELEALALEANLIKQYRPKYNVCLRDDKNYPYLRLSTDEYWPRLDIVRRTARDKALYFGPYVPSSSMYEALSFIRKNFTIRPCRYRMDQDMKPMRPCIQHQMGRCGAPCAWLVSHDEYMQVVNDVVKFLKGKRSELLTDLRTQMQEHSQALQYEEAARIRDRIRALERAWESQKVIAPELGDIDVVGLVHSGDEAVAQVFFIRSGTMIGARDYVLRDVRDVGMPELMNGFLMSFYLKEIVPPALVLLSAEPEDAETLTQWLSRQAGRSVSMVVPRRGKKFELLRMAQDNAQIILSNRESTARAVDTTVEELRQRLDLPEPPRSIGAFDISNFSGGEPVGAFIWWEDGEFKKENYRHVRIRDVKGIDDYAMMRETVRRVLSSIEPPSLVVIDGGRTHLEAAFESVRDMEPMPRLISVAKRPDRAFEYFREEPHELEDRRPSSLLLKKIRDEVHRFAISHHKKLRDKRLMESPLEKVPGIGKKRRLELLREFGGIDEIRNASVEDLARVKGMTAPAAEALKAALNTQTPEVSDKSSPS